MTMNTFLHKTFITWWVLVSIPWLNSIIDKVWCSQFWKVPIVWGKPSWTEDPWQGWAWCWFMEWGCFPCRWIRIDLHKSKPPKEPPALKHTSLWPIPFHCFSQSIKTYQTNEPISHPILLYTHFQVLFTKHTSKSHKPHVYSIFQLLFQTHLWVFLDFQVKIAPKSN